MDTASSRERSPLRYPASANLGLPPSYASLSDVDHQQQSDFAHTYNAQGLDQTQYLQHNLTQSAQDPNALTLDDLNNYQSMINNSHLGSTTLSNHTSPATDFPNYSDNTLISDIDPIFQQQTFTNDAMSTVLNNHSPTPPHLLPGMNRKSSSPSPLASLNTQQGYMNRPRNTSESLDPSSAYDLPQQNGSWDYVARGHRRMHSDNLSDVSSHSAQASPYLATMESFDQAASPMLNPQDPAFSDGLGIGQFSISDPVLQARRQSYHSPAHSPHISPALMPIQQPLPQFTASDNFGLNGQYIQDYNDISPSNEMGLGENLSPPAINIDYAPSIKVETVRLSGMPTDDGLSPPARSRARAKSDSHAGSTRPMITPANFNRGRSPSLQPSGALSPFAPQSNFSYSNPSSREASPAALHGSVNGMSAQRGRSASAASDRDRMLGLADPARSPSNTGDNKRQQKHPATFQCHLCTKRFTRAYNLRSHLRTHTDERPFVCTVCDKAFARQHDRKRHEGLHSGEKKFVCRGLLKSGGHWGCNRRFARADALGRHFRSEAGRICIKPLLDEEASEQQQQAMWQEQTQVGGYPQQMGEMPYFPQALLAQFPQLAGLDLNQMQQVNMTGEDDYAGRSSFDHSSGGEMYDELSENEMGIGSMNVNAPPAYGMQQQQQMGYSGPQMGDFSNGFEGR